MVLNGGVAVGALAWLVARRRLAELRTAVARPGLVLLALAVATAAIGLQLLAILEIWVGLAETLEARPGLGLGSAARLVALRRAGHRVAGGRGDGDGRRRGTDSPLACASRLLPAARPWAPEPGGPGSLAVRDGPPLRVGSPPPGRVSHPAPAAPTLGRTHSARRHSDGGPPLSENATRKSGALVAGAVFALLALATVVVGSREWLPPLASTHGLGIDRTLIFLLSATGIMFLVGHLLLAWAIWRYSGRSAISFRTLGARREKWIGLGIGVAIVLIAEGGVLAIGHSAWSEFYAQAPRRRVGRGGHR